MEEYFTLKELLLKGDIQASLVIVEELEEMDISIRNAVLEIQGLNERPQGRGVYLQPEDLVSALEKAYPQAVNRASLEVEEGRYEPTELETLVNREELINRAITLISLAQES